MAIRSIKDSSLTGGVKQSTLSKVQQVVRASGGTETTFTGNGTIGVNGQGYKVHSFTASGTLTVAAPGFAEILLVGGGGGGGTSFSGGGGAGGFLNLGRIYLPTGSHSVAVGAGGAGSGSSATWASAGQESSITINGVEFAAAGGGGGGSNGVANQQYLGNGASGGGGTSVANSYGRATQAMGSGSNGSNGDGSHGGCGGGAGGAPVGYVSGAGLASSITGTLLYYATGAAGDVCTSNATLRAVANSGDGGGPGASGYSGIVIVRYAVD